jgi:hypothetical protein
VDHDVARCRPRRSRHSAYSHEPGGTMTIPCPTVANPRRPTRR